MTSFRLKKPTLSSIPRTILFFGGSRGVGYHALRCLLHLHPDLRCLLFLRDAEAFRKSTEGDDLFRYLKQRDMQDRVRLFKGNVLDLRAVQAVLAHAGEELSAVIYAIGHTASSGFWSGVNLCVAKPRSSEEICTRGMVNLVQSLADVRGNFNSPPRLIVISSLGVEEDGQDMIPYILRPIYKYGLASMVEDKRAMEAVLSRVLCNPSTHFPTTDYVPRSFPSATEANPRLLPPQLISALPKPFLMPSNLTVIRPALLTDDKAKGVYRVIKAGTRHEVEERVGMYSISWKDVGELVCSILIGQPFDATEWRGHQLLLYDRECVNSVHFRGMPQ